MNSNFNNSDVLKIHQYRNSQNLVVRTTIHKNYSTNQQNIHDWFFEIVLPQTPSKAKLLEVGTGRGDSWKYGIGRLPETWDLTLTDFSEGMLEDNKANLGAFAEKVNYQIVDVQNIPFPDHHFDIIFANFMLYHIPDIAKAISELRRVLKPDGVLFAMTHGENTLHEIYTLAAQVDTSVKWDSIFSRTFSLQNGTAQLMHRFTDIQMKLFKGDLWFTDVQPLLDYVSSLISHDGQTRLAELEPKIRADFEKQIQAEGGILIKKEHGLFIAHGMR